MLYGDMLDGLVVLKVRWLIILVITSLISDEKYIRYSLSAHIKH